MIGYDTPLYILPFDHKTGIMRSLFGFDKDTLTSEQKEIVKDTRALIYEGFKLAIEKGIPKECAALLTDEEFGKNVLQDGKKEGYVIMLNTEKSGQDELEFEYGEGFGQHIEKFKPNFVKVLVRYNAEGDREINSRQLVRLKALSHYSHEHGYKFLIEPLVPAIDAQLAEAGSKENYDRALRPQLTVQMIQEFQNAGVEPDIWKIEGMETEEDYQEVVKSAQAGETRKQVGVVVLGRAETIAHVDHWITTGAKVPGVIGFAVGRTVFGNAIKNYVQNSTERQQAIEEIADNFFHFYQVFIDAKK